MFVKEAQGLYIKKLFITELPQEIKLCNSLIPRLGFELTYDNMINVKWTFQKPSWSLSHDNVRSRKSDTNTISWISISWIKIAILLINSYNKTTIISIYHGIQTLMT